MQILMETTAGESLNAAANIFFGAVSMKYCSVCVTIKMKYKEMQRILSWDTHLCDYLSNMFHKI